MIGVSIEPLNGTFHFMPDVLPPWSGLAGLRVRCTVLLLLALATVCCIAQSSLKLSEYQKRNWQVEEGLPDNDVRMVAQRPDGMLLIATSSGIYRFDGLHFRPLSESGAEKAESAAGNHAVQSEAGQDEMARNEAINAILPVGNDELWVGTDGRGVLHYTNAGIVNISEQAGYFHERVRNFCLDSNGVLWIATQNGVERYKNGQLERIAETGMVSGNFISPFAEDGDGGMFYVTSSGLYHWSNGKAVRFALPLAKGEVPVAAYRDSAHHIWIGTSSHLLELVPHGSHGHMRFEDKVRAAISGDISTMRRDTAGNLWIGTWHSGLWRLASDGLSRWTVRDGLADEAIRSLFQDDEQNMWIAMSSGGLSRWRKGALVPYAGQELNAAHAANVLADSHGDVWLGTWDKGLFRLHNGILANATPRTMPGTATIRALAEDRKGQVWVGTWFNGVYRYDGREFHHYLLGNESPGNAVSAMLPASNGGLWVGMYTGLLYFPSGQPDRHNYQQLLESQLITCLTEDKDGTVWVGTSTGLFRVRNGKTAAIPELARSYISSIVQDSGGYLWVGTKASGLTLLRKGRVTPVPANAGLPNLPVNSATEDKDGHLWLGTPHGIVRVPLRELHDVMDGRRATISAVLLDKADGMRSSECNGLSRPLSARLPDGTLWFVTAKGYVHTTDTAEKMDVVHPVASIVGWNPSVDPNSADLAPTSSDTEITLEPGHQDLLLFFNAKLLSNPGHIEFRYRLSNYDSGWTTTRARVARYRRLPPGNYTFEVQARSAGEEWSTPIASIGVRQRPYLYQSWYFYVAILILVATVIAQLFRYRMQLMKGRIGIILEERSRIARECHDTLMAGFAAVSWQLEATAKLFRDSKSENTPPAESCELARSMVAHCQAEARRIIWDLRDTDEVTGILSHALTRTLSMNVAPETIETTFDVDGEELPLAPGCVHQLVCIGQEAVSNAIRHANPTRITIHLKYEADMLVLSIRDNGNGFQRVEHMQGIRGHFGIPVMEERARKVGGILRVFSTVGGGTEVTVKVPFNDITQPMNSEHHIIHWIGI